MKILGIDTTAVTAAAALMEDEVPLAVYAQNGTMTHSETMLHMIENLLRNAKCTVDDIDMFAVSAGPGSFTGVRIGVSIIKGLAFAKNKPCVPVSALHALAENLRPLAVLHKTFYACPVMDARRGQLYQALFCCQMEENGAVLLERVTEDRMIEAKALEAELSSLHIPIIFVGEGCRVTETQICLPHAKEAPLPLRFQNGCSVAAAARWVYETAPDPSIFTDTLLKPSYLRDSQAERERREKERQNNK